MRRILAILALTCGTAVLLTVGLGASEGDRYRVRAAFDNGGFLVAGEEVRVAGARVGEIESVGVSLGDEAVHEDGRSDPGKAIVVMQIDDPAFQDFREDASCLIRPQSLLGEKFVECEPTQPRAPGVEPPPELAEIGEGEPGAGQRLLPLERNGKAVDLDLVNNIMREPYPDRFRLILNDLGAGLAARGEELEQIVLRGNPALRETNEVLAILAEQSDRLEDLARDGDRSLAPLARERESITRFVNAAGATGAATAERGAELEAGLRKLPGFLRELEPTMVDLAAFSTQATPVLSDLGVAAPALTRSTRALGPFARAGTRALVSLGDAADASTEDLVASQPVIRDLGTLAEGQIPGANELRLLLEDLRASGGTAALMRLLFNATGSVNGFDSFGHFTRGVVPVNNCFAYEITPEGTCDTNFTRTFGSAREARAAAERKRSAPLTDPGAVRGLLDFFLGPDARGGQQVPAPEGGTEEPTEEETTDQEAAE